VAKRPASPANDRPQVRALEWAGGIRLSGFSVTMLSLVVFAVWALVPNIGTFVDQRQKIAAMQESVQVTEDRLHELQLERERWSDPAYVSTQARERLFYVRPGEIIYLIDNDLELGELPADLPLVSEEVEVRQGDWLPQLLRSITGAGLSRTAVGTP
jgi:cell division protein FtsB